MSAAEYAHLDFEEYLRFEERQTELKHELVGGTAYAMTGAARQHNLLAGAIVAAIRNAALAEGCRPYVNDMMVRVDDDAYYPDVMVACGEPPHDRYETAPCLIVEVLSPSTSTIDHREKLAQYTRIPFASGVPDRRPARGEDRAPPST